MKAWRMYIRQADLDAFGYTPGCKTCQSMVGRGKGETSAPHSEICRTRIMAEMAKTDGGISRLACMNEHVDRYVAERSGEGDQHASQGRTAGNAPHVVLLAESAPFDAAEAATRAGSSADIRDTVANDVPSIAKYVPPAGHDREAPDNDIVIEPPGTQTGAGYGLDVDLVCNKDQAMESCRVRNKKSQF